MGRTAVTVILGFEAIPLVDGAAQTLSHGVARDGRYVVAISNSCHDAGTIAAKALGVLHHARSDIRREKCPRQFFNIDPREVRFIMGRLEHGNLLSVDGNFTELAHAATLRG